MGHFLAVTAVRSDSTQEVARAVCDYVQSHGVTYEVPPAGSPLKDDRDAQIFAPANGWSIILWPAYFNLHDFALARNLASSTGWLISTIHVYDGDYWEHLAVQGSTELHSFCSRPTYWEDEAEELERVGAFDSSPERLAAAAGVEASALSPYLVDVDAAPEAQAKVHPDDQCTLDDFWVFTDFWNRLGITYPDPPDNAATVIRLAKGFDRKLPSL